MNSDGSGSPFAYSMFRTSSPHSEGGTGLVVDAITASPPKTVISVSGVDWITDTQSTTARSNASVSAKNGNVDGAVLTFIT